MPQPVVPADRWPATGHPPDVGAAPGRLELVRMFVNTLDIELGADQLNAPDALVSWLASHDLLPEADASGSRAPAPGPVAGWADLRRAIELREALRGILLSHVGHGRAAAVAGPVTELRRIARSLPVRLAIGDDGQVAAVAAGSATAAGLAAILLIAADASVTGAWARLKVCGADDCRWAFYDRSPTRSACWCSMAICGARAKSRAYRQRASVRR
jgi:predicted RNA-binding Zn ribbon-like protein